MKTLDSGSGNSGDLNQVCQKALREKKFRYIIVTKSSATPGMIGGSFNFQIRGTDDIQELLKPDILRRRTEVIDTRTLMNVSKPRLVRRYLESLNKKEKSILIDEALEKFLTT